MCPTMEAAMPPGCMAQGREFRVGELAGELGQDGRGVMEPRRLRTQAAALVAGRPGYSTRRGGPRGGFRA